MILTRKVAMILSPATIPNSAKILISVTTRTKNPTAVVKFVMSVTIPIFLIILVNALIWFPWLAYSW